MLIKFELNIPIHIFVSLLLRSRLTYLGSVAKQEHTIKNEF